MLPLEEATETMEEIEHRCQMGIREDYMISWAPDRHGAKTFPRDLPEGEGRLARYPSQDDTDEDLAEDNEELETTMNEDENLAEAQQ